MATAGIAVVLRRRPAAPAPLRSAWRGWTH